MDSSISQDPFAPDDEAAVKAPAKRASKSRAKKPPAAKAAVKAPAKRASKSRAKSAR